MERPSLPPHDAAATRTKPRRTAAVAESRLSSQFLLDDGDQENGARPVAGPGAVERISYLDDERLVLVRAAEGADERTGFATVEVEDTGGLGAPWPVDAAAELAHKSPEGSSSVWSASTVAVMPENPLPSSVPSSMARP